MWKVLARARSREWRRLIDHLAPLVGFIGNQFPEIGRRARKRSAAEISEPRHHFGIGKSLIDRLIEPFDNLSGRTGHTDAEPSANLVARHKIGDRRQVRRPISAPTWPSNASRTARQ
jgi:hypothetical protein